MYKPCMLCLSCSGDVVTLRQDVKTMWWCMCQTTMELLSRSFGVL